jgi:hypothetical protein
MNEMRSKLTAEDYDLVRGDDGHDTPFRDRQSMVLVYGSSPELVFGGSRYVKGAEIGGYVAPQGDKRVPMKSVLMQTVVFTLTHPEYTLGDGEGDRGQFVCDHGVKPPSDMKFLKASGGLVKKTGHYRVGADGKPGNKVAPTITAYGLVNGFGASYAMYGTAYGAGREFAGRAERLMVRVDPPLIITQPGGPAIDVPELRGCALGIFELTSRFEKMGPYRVPVPVMTLVGKLGEEGGPTLEQWSP